MYTGYWSTELIVVIQSKLAMQIWELVLKIWYLKPGMKEIPNGENACGARRKMRSAEKCWHLEA